MATRSEVRDFLREVSAAVELGHCKPRSRPKDMRALIELKMTPKQRWEAIQRLTADNYSTGPEPDDTDRSKDVWVFGYEQEGKEVYIKLRLAQDPRRRTVKNLFVWSFHRAEHAMKYPLRGDKS